MRNNLFGGMIEVIITMWQVLLNYDLPPSVELKTLCEKVFYFNTELRRIPFLYDTPESAASQNHTIGILSKLDSKDKLCKNLR
jgi:hypothetical protein